MDLFLLKKIIGIMLMPLSIVLILLFIAIIFYCKKPTLSFSALTSASMVLFLSTFSPFSDIVTAPLEHSYPAFTHSIKPVDYIIILGCTHTTDHSLPATSQLKYCSLSRLVEAVRIYHLHPEAQIITSGYADNNELSNAETVKRAAILLGIPAHKILTENFPQDTEEEAQLIAPRVLNKSVVLVTNSKHLPRAMAYFSQYGIDAIPAPAGPQVQQQEHNAWDYYVPNASNLQQTSMAWYETLGRIVQWLKS